MLPRRYLIMIGPLASDHPLLHCLYNTPIVVVVISKACNSTLRGCKQLVTTTTAANCSERAAVAFAFTQSLSSLPNAKKTTRCHKNQFVSQFFLLYSLLSFNASAGRFNSSDTRSSTPSMYPIYLLSKFSSVLIRLTLGTGLPCKLPCWGCVFRRPANVLFISELLGFLSILLWNLSPTVDPGVYWYCPLLCSK